MEHFRKRLASGNILSTSFYTFFFSLSLSLCLSLYVSLYVSFSMSLSLNVSLRSNYLSPYVYVCGFFCLWVCEWVYVCSFRVLVRRSPVKMECRTRTDFCCLVNTFPTNFSHKAGAASNITRHNPKKLQLYVTFKW